MVDECLKSRFMKESEREDLIWICVELENEKLYVGGVYLVPPSSSRAWKAVDLVEEIGQDVALYSRTGHVIVAGDWNCKVGTQESLAREKVFERKSVSECVDV